jgi:hypothetical protein
LRDGGVLYPPLLDEHGDAYPPETLTYTGTDRDGNADEDSLYTDEFGNNTYNCDNWTKQEGYVVVGLLGSGGMFSWTEASFVDCQDAPPAPIYCFGVDLNPSSFTYKRSTGRIAFVSKSAYLLTSLADADQKCQAEATQAGQAGTFVALLSDTTVSAKDHAAPVAQIRYVRPDGIPLVENGLDLFGDAKQKPLISAFSAQLDGQYYAGLAWAGTARYDQVGADNQTCNNWTTTTGQKARAVFGGRTFDTPSLTVGCDFAWRLHCVQK